jgi:hypothetical protein
LPKILIITLTLGRFIKIISLLFYFKLGKYFFIDQVLEAKGLNGSLTLPLNDVHVRFSNKCTWLMVIMSSSCLCSSV